MLKTVTMKPIHLVMLTVVQLVSTESVGSFFNPPQMPHDVEVLFSSNPIYRAGEVISVEWTTTYSEYTIALWQQDLIQDGAVLGPIVFEANPPAKPDFLWTVQTYSLNLAESNVFFLWLHPGESSEQGDKRNVTMATHYFNITDEPIPSTSSSTTTSTSTTAAVSTLQNTDTNNTVPGQGQQSLSTGVIAGIAVGATLGGVLGIACVVVLWIRRSRQRKEDDGVPVGQSGGSMPHSDSDNSKYQGTTAELMPQWTERHPVELFSDPTPSHRQVPVELG